MDPKLFEHQHIRQAIVKGALEGEFWQLMLYDLQEVYRGAILDLTRTVPTVDNLGLIAGFQARANLAQELMSKPYNLLGIPGPR